MSPTLAWSQFEFKTQKNTPWRVQADTATCSESRCVLTGHVIVDSGNTHLSADTLTIIFDTVSQQNANKKIKSVFAEGQVFLVEDNKILHCTHVELDPQMTTGVLLFADLHIKNMDQATSSLKPDINSLHQSFDTLKLSGQKITKYQNQRYMADHMYVTFCDCGPSHKATFSLLAKRADVTLQESAVLYLPSFQIFDIKLPFPFTLPILYLPLSARKTGFLAPRFLFPQNDVFYIEETFFWAISKSYDMSISLGYNITRGLRESLEFRYFPKPGIKGFLFLSHTHDNFYGDQKISQHKDNQLGQERFSVIFRHEHTINKTISARIKLNLLSDAYYMHDFSYNVLTQTSTQYYANRAISEFKSDHFRLSVGSVYYQDPQSSRYFLNAPSQKTPQRLVEILAHYQPAKMPWQLHLNSESRLILSRNLTAEIGTQEDSTNSTLPSVFCKIQTIKDCVRPTLNGRLDSLLEITRPTHLYGTHLNPGLLGYASMGFNNLEKNPNTHGFLGIKLDWSVPLLRVFNLAYQTTSNPNENRTVRHLINPFIQYLWIPYIFSPSRNNDIQERTLMNRTLDERDFYTEVHQLALGVSSSVFLQTYQKVAQKKPILAQSQPLLDLYVVQYFNLPSFPIFKKPIWLTPYWVGETAIKIKLQTPPLMVRSYRMNISISSETYVSIQKQQLSSQLIEFNFQDSRENSLEFRYERFFQGGSARIKRGLFELAPSGILLHDKVGGSYHSSGVQIHLVPWQKRLHLRYGVMLQLPSLEPNALETARVTSVLYHTAAIQYVSGCHCASIQINAQFPAGVFKHTNPDDLKSPYITPMVGVQLTLGSINLGASGTGFSTSEQSQGLFN